MFKLIFLFCAAVILVASDIEEVKQEEQLDDTNSIELTTKRTVIGFGGKIQLTSMYLWPEGSFYAGKIPLERDSLNENGEFFMNARDSRLWMKTKTPSKLGMVRTLIETDFWGATTNANEINTNSHGVRLRHAYVDVAGFTVGQTNSAFNTYVMLDTVTHTINETLVRQPLIRYTIDNNSVKYDISIEQPETTLLTTSADTITPKDDTVPDVVLRARYYMPWGEMGFAAMGRYITQNRADVNSSTSFSKSDGEFAHAFNLSMKLNTFDYDDIRFDVQYGLGLGRYLAYNAFSAGTVDDSGDIKLHKSYGAHLGYRHWWKSDLRSTVAISYAATDNNLDVIKESELDKVNKSVKALQANLFYTPIHNGLVGLEYAKAIRTVESSDKGTMEVFMLVFRYDF